MSMQINLSKRLELIANEVKKGAKVADIGTDHAYIPIYLVQNDIAQCVYACDIKEGPLLSAKENISAYGCGEKIETRLSNGLQAMKSGEFDTVIIAGMGGELIRDIISDAKHLRSKYIEYILSPHSKLCEFRAYLRTQSYKTVKEFMLKCSGKFYTVIKVVYDPDVVPEYKEDKNELYDTYGYYLIKNKDKVLYEYLQKEEKKYENIIKRLKNKADEEGLSHKLELIKEALYEMQ